MQVIILIALTTCFILLPSKALVAKFLSAIIAFSVIASFLLPPAENAFSFNSLMIYLYTGGVLFCMLFTLRHFKSEDKSIRSINRAQYLFVYIVIFLGVVCFIINVYIVFSTLRHFLSGDFTVVEFKNEGDTQLKLQAFVNPYLLTYTNYINAIGFLGLGLHFYFLAKGKSYWLVFTTLLVSLNIPLSGLQYLSRAFTVLFLIEYMLFFIYLKDAIPSHTKKLMYRAGSIVVTVILVMFFIISYNRFGGERGYYNVPDESLVKDPTLYSTLDYFSQWVRNGLVTLEQFDLTKFWMGKNFSTLFDRIHLLLGGNPIPYVDLRYDTLGLYYSKFNGVVSALVYDLTPVGVIIFLIINALGVRYFTSCRDKMIEFGAVLMFPFFTCIPAMFFTNNFAVYLNIQLGFIFSLCFVMLRKIRFYGGGKHTSIPRQ